MKFNPPLKPAILIYRYKRFLADVVTSDGKQITIYCPNTGAMTGCATSGNTIWYSNSTSFKRKYKHTWQITQTLEGAFICINTQQANYLVKEALANDQLAELTGYSRQKNEVKYGNENSKIDFILQSDARPECYVEVKSVTLAEKNNGYFPDTKTLRGQKHLRELMSIVGAGKRAVLLFVVLHSAIDYLFPACHIDLNYTQLLIEAYTKGVEIFAYKAEISTNDITLKELIPITI